jgi:hypothetical protein
MNTRGETRTLTGQFLKLVPLPLGYPRMKYRREDLNLQNPEFEAGMSA